MQQLAQIFGYCLLAWLFALAAIIALRMLSGKIPVQGLLTTAGGVPIRSASKVSSSPPS
jgi:hypothetical protein